MSTLLDNSDRPLWVWIVAIVVGSLAILGAITWFIRYWIRRRRIRCDIEFASDEPAEKKLTLRRGRIVPAASYLSLTGSRFGINSYVTEDGRETPSVRSKSPFEWWANLRGRSSRLSYVSHISSTQFPSSPRTASFYQRPEMSTSKLSLASKTDTLRATVTEVKVAKPQPATLTSSFKRSSRSVEPVNFSRSFTSQTYRPSAPQHTKTLSRISEITPRQSMFSAASLKVRAGSIDASEHSQNADQQVFNRASSGSLLQVPASSNHTRKQSSSSSRELLQHYNNEHVYPLGQHPSGLASSPYLPSTPSTPTFPPPATDTMPIPLPQHGLWESSMKQFPWLDHHQQSYPNELNCSQTVSTDVHYTQPHTYIQGQMPQQIATVDGVMQYQQPIPQRLSQLPVPPIPLRTRSKKGNVLRKKSLDRAKTPGLYH